MKAESYFNSKENKIFIQKRTKQRFILQNNELLKINIWHSKQLQANIKGLNKIKIIQVLIQLTKNQNRHPAQDLFTRLEKYIFSGEFEKKSIKCPSIYLRYNILISHSWIIQNHFRQYYSLFTFRKSFDTLLQQYPQQFMFQFDDDNNILIRHELERAQRVIYFVLDDYYRYDFKEKCLQQIIDEDILLKQQTMENVKKTPFVHYGTQKIYTTHPLKPGEDDDVFDIIIETNLCPQNSYVIQMCSTMTCNFMLTSSGLLYSWGVQCECLGRQSSAKQEASKPIEIKFSGKVIQVTSGSNHVLALDMHGYITSWGKNECGQLGHHDTDPQKEPKEIEFLKKQPCAQIYANGDSSFAITKKGNLYVWGDNRCSQLGLVGPLHDEPRLVTHTPWEGSKEPKIVHGKTNIGKIYIMQLDHGERYLQELKQQAVVKEMESELQRLNSKMADVNVNAVVVQQKQDHGGDDFILRETQQQISKTEVLKKNQSILLKEIKERVVELNQDLQDIKSQLKDVQEKENQLNTQREEIDMAVRKLSRTNAKGAECEAKIKEQNRIKELFQANDNIKNTLLKRQNVCETAKIEAEQGLQEHSDKYENMNSLLMLLGNIEKERRIYLRTKYLEQNKADLEKFMDKINHFFRQMIDTNISEIARKSTTLCGLTDMLEQSNQKLNYIKQELSGFKMNSNDESYEILSKILDIVYDNLNSRKKLNEYISGIIMSVVDKTQKDIEPEPNQLPKKLLDIIIKQQTDIQKAGKDFVSLNSYVEQLKQTNEYKVKPRSFCFGMF
ncbi:hypothetical protein pb186bvf_012516 [Paramecium bursaria]